MVTWEVGKYKIIQYARIPPNAVIRLEEKNGNRALHAYFMEPPGTNSVSADGSFFFLYYSFEQFAPMMEMLREEKPIWVRYDNSNNAWIGTALELPGEDEG